MKKLKVAFVCMMTALIIVLLWGIFHKASSEQVIQPASTTVVETVVEVAPTHFVEMSSPVVTNDPTEATLNKLGFSTSNMVKISVK